MNLTWVGPMLLVSCVVAVFLIGGTGWLTICLLALLVTAAHSLRQRSRV